MAHSKRNCRLRSRGSKRAKDQNYSSDTAYKAARKQRRAQRAARRQQRRG